MTYKEYKGSKWFPKHFPRGKEKHEEPLWVKMISCIKPVKKDMSFQDWVVIDHTGSAYVCFNFIVTLSCLFSCYLYITMAAFRELHSGGVAGILVLLFEILFAVHLAV